MEPKLTITRCDYWLPVAVDELGRPLEHGEPMIEVEPGVWQSPVLVEALRFFKGLAEALRLYEEAEGGDDLPGGRVRPGVRGEAEER